MFARLIKGKHYDILNLLMYATDDTKNHHLWLPTVHQNTYDLWPIIMNDEDDDKPNNEQIHEFLFSTIEKPHSRKKLRTLLFSFANNRRYVREAAQLTTGIIEKPVHACDFPECGKTFASPAALALHRIREHNVYPPIDYYINTKWCPICLHMHHSIGAVKQHLHHKDSRCAPLLIMNQYRPNTIEQFQAAHDTIPERRESQRKKGQRENKSPGVAWVEGPMPYYLNAQGLLVDPYHKRPQEEYHALINQQQTKDYQAMFKSTRFVFHYHVEQVMVTNEMTKVTEKRHKLVNINLESRLHDSLADLPLLQEDLYQMWDCNCNHSWPRNNPIMRYHRNFQRGGHSIMDRYPGDGPREPFTSKPYY